MSRDLSLHASATSAHFLPEVPRHCNSQLGYEKKGNDTTVYIQATGDTSVEEIKARLKDDECQYGLIKAVGVDPKGAVVSKRNKYIFFTFNGPSVPMMKRVPAADVKKAVGSYFQGHHLSLEIDDRAALDHADFEKRLRAAGGAHQPERIEFGSGSKVDEYTPTTQPTA